MEQSKHNTGRDIKYSPIVRLPSYWSNKKNNTNDSWSFLLMLTVYKEVQIYLKVKARCSVFREKCRTIAELTSTPSHTTKFKKAI